MDTVGATGPTPRFGFGFDWQHRRRYPRTIADVCEQYADRLSHLSCVSLPDALAARTFVADCAKGLPVVHHLPGVAPAAPQGPNLELLERLEAVSDELDAVWICEDIGLWSVGPYPLPYFTPPLFEQESADHVIAGIEAMREVTRYPFVPEIPSCTLAVGRMTLGDYFHRITDGADCDMLLDVAHVFSYAVATGRRYEQVLTSLPLERVVEIHVAGGYVDPTFGNRYLDTHSHSMAPEVIELMQQALPNCPRLRAVTYEIGVDLSSDDLDQDVERVDRALAEAGWTPDLTSAARTVPVGAR
ncbi:hypothetical protein DN069_32255 [Streptacidiphilus pinicola]|uniref:DUF692 domain-containing protein n=1 Tax=Streptacidiphilus pinicola TaxID=2219663 RepID=A0A2X0K1U2_9ACTN|nr:DUF692 family multinuclear iron-containing protein [Streptacidiphilus pinicola]RAG81529.1 hypothetical protein DN069_32255 [Streptacidiphilus pinicola]